MITNLFSTPIYTSKIDNLVRTQTEIQVACHDLDLEMTDKLHVYLSDPTFEENILEHCPQFQKEIDKHVERYCASLGFEIRPYQIESSWIALYKKGNFCHIHEHGHVDISGVYYYDTSGDDGNLFFICPTPGLLSSPAYRQKSMIHEESPEIGKIVLFPGWLHHGVEINTTDSTRICVAFNIVFER